MFASICVCTGIRRPGSVVFVFFAFGRFSWLSGRMLVVGPPPAPMHFPVVSSRFSLLALLPAVVAPRPVAPIVHVDRRRRPSPEQHHSFALAKPTVSGAPIDDETLPKLPAHQRRSQAAQPQRHCVTPQQEKIAITQQPAPCLFSLSPFQCPRPMKRGASRCRLHCRRRRRRTPCRFSSSSQCTWQPNHSLGGPLRSERRGKSAGYQEPSFRCDGSGIAGLSRPSSSVAVYHLLRTCGALGETEGAAHHHSLLPRQSRVVKLTPPHVPLTGRMTKETRRCDQRAQEASCRAGFSFFGANATVRSSSRSANPAPLAGRPGRYTLFSFENIIHHDLLVTLHRYRHFFFPDPKSPERPIVRGPPSLASRSLGECRRRRVSDV
ncbi:hypothetical protein BKA81DRAFT_376680 [Phyllosticta paracitricarpa]